MHVLVTGGLGYIGSHTVIELCASGHSVTIIDNCSNSEHTMLETLRTLTGADIQYINADCAESLEHINPTAPFDMIIHFAAYKYVGESNSRPYKYYYNNIRSLLNILAIGEMHGCKKLIFSSSATVYPNTATPPFIESDASPGNTRYDTMRTGNNPYGTSKIMCEQILHDIAAADPTWHILCLRYFNPVGNHASGKIGDTIKGSLYNNLFPAICGALRSDKPVHIFGDDYNTVDGTAVRDYIHVCDLAEAHVRGASYLQVRSGIQCMNVGCGHGHSVLEIVREFQNQDAPLKYEMRPRRNGDAENVYADISLMKRELGWVPSRTLKNMVHDTLQFLFSNE